MVNLLVRGLLRTPGPAAIVGGRLVILYVVGRKSGRRYCVPVAYMAEGNDVHVSTTEPEVVSAYAHMARVNPTFAKFSSIHVAEDGQPDRCDLHLAWAGGARAIRLTPQ